MSGEYLTAPGLLAHVFMAAQGQDASIGWERLRFLWAEVTGELGLDRAIASLGVAARVPREDVLPAGGHGLLAAAESEAEAIWQGLAWADHGLLCVTVMMAPPRDDDCAEAWTGLEAAWGRIAASLPHTGVVGEARILLALLEGQSDNARLGDPAGPEGEAITVRTLDLVREAVEAGQAPSAAGWWRHWDMVRLDPGGDQAPVWEIGPESADSRSVRRLVVVAPERLERQVDYFLWTHGDGSPTPLTRHLMYAARLRSQVRVFDDGRASRRLRDEVSRLVDEVSSEPADWRDLADQLAAGNQRLDRLARAQADAVGLRARLDAMRLDVGEIGQEMARAVSLIAADVAVGPLSEDQYLATWLDRRLEDEIAVLDAAGANARTAAALIGGVAAPLRLLPGPRTRANERTASSPRARQQPRQAGSAAPWVVILTALPVEYEAIREYLGGEVTSRAASGTLYEVGEIPGIGRSWRLAIAQAGPGSATAGVQLERAIHVFRPEIALFLGVAGGRKDVARGDVVAADRIYDYESGKYVPEGYLPRMSAYKPAYRLVQRAQLIARESRWQQRIRPVCPDPPPRAFVKPIATGAKVVADNRSAIARLLDRYASDALAVETEGHGFLEGAYVNPGVDALVIRGISDLLAGKDQAGDEYWQPIASRHAAAFAVELLSSLGTTIP